MPIQTFSIHWFKVIIIWLGWCFACILVVLIFLRYFPQRQIRGNMRKCVSQMTDIELDGASVAKITLFQGWPSKKSPIFNTMYENLHKLYSNVLCILQMYSIKNSKKVRSHTLAVIVNHWKIQILPKQWIGNEVWDQLQKSLVVHLGLGVLKLVSYLNAVSTLKNSLLFKENRQIELCPPVQSKACLLWIPCLGDKIHFAPFQERESRPAMAPGKNIWLLQRFLFSTEDPSVGSECGTRVWDPCVGSECGIRV